MFDEYKAIVPEKDKGYDIGIMKADFAALYSNYNYPITIVSVEEAVAVVKSDPRYFIAVFREEESLVEYLKKELPSDNILIN